MEGGIWDRVHTSQGWWGVGWGGGVMVEDVGEMLVGSITVHNVPIAESVVSSKRLPALFSKST